MRVRSLLQPPMLAIAIELVAGSASAQSTPPTRPPTAARTPPAPRATTAPRATGSSAAPRANATSAAPNARAATTNAPTAARASNAPPSAPTAARASNAPSSAPAAAARVETTPTPTTVASSSAPPATPADEHRAAIARIEAQAAQATPASARAIGQTILHGAAPDVVATALDALAALGRTEGAPAVAHSLRHRRALVRRHAIGAARAIHTPELVDALGDLLGDPDAAVRLDSALALADVGNRAVGSRVVEAFERDLDDAQGPDGGPLTRPCALAIGRFGSSDDVRHLLGFLGRAPLRAITDAMREAVRRAALPETLRVQIVTAIGRLATRDARVFLETVIADAGGQDNALVRAARESAARIGE